MEYNENERSLATTGNERPDVLAKLGLLGIQLGPESFCGIPKSRLLDPKNPHDRVP